MAGQAHLHVSFQEVCKLGEGDEVANVRCSELKYYSCIKICTPYVVLL